MNDGKKGWREKWTIVFSAVRNNPIAQSSQTIWRVISGLQPNCVPSIELRSRYLRTWLNCVWGTWGHGRIVCGAPEDMVELRAPRPKGLRLLPRSSMAAEQKFVSDKMLQIESGLISRVKFVKQIPHKFCLERLSSVYLFVGNNRFALLIFNMEHGNETIINLIWVKLFLKTR